MKLRFTPRAMNDLTAIRRFIQDEYGKPESSQAHHGQYFCPVRKPQAVSPVRHGAQRRFEIDTDVRYLVCEGYMIFYRIEGEFVSVGAVIHGKTDYLDVLFRKER